VLEGRIEALTAAQLAGQLLVVGFDGPRLPAQLRASLQAGERAGVVLFRRNASPGRVGLGELQLLCAEVRDQSASNLPALIAIDEEGGRVARLSPPALTLPAMRRIAEVGDLELVERVGRAVGSELSCLGITMNFAPVVDVDTNPDNPVIGDRAFANDPEKVVELAGAYMRGLRSGGVQNCLKHFPGHGDTLLDSHKALPTVTHDRQRLEQVELLPFRRLASVADSMMTAHVVYTGLDAAHPATLSASILVDLLRRELAFDGVLFSDDLEMQAIAGHGLVEESAVLAIRAGCDLLLICSSADAQERAHQALTRTVERDAAFRSRSVEAVRRSLGMRQECPPQPGSLLQLDALMSSELRPLEAELTRRLAQVVS
jgi:beta-N-acetylhexosaminidase